MLGLNPGFLDDCSCLIPLSYEASDIWNRIHSVIMSMTVRRTIMTDSSPYSRQEIEECNEVDDDEQNDDCSGREGE